jgi:gluconokinase
LIIVVMGVSGAGKTTVGKLLAAELGWPFYDADDFHSQANVRKMQAGVALTDADRAGWLDALATHIARLERCGTSAVIACSALKRAYRARLRGVADAAGTAPAVRFVYLKGSPNLIRKRLASRVHHFMPPALLASQFETLEEPATALTVDVAAPPAAIVRRIRAELHI